MSETNFKNYNLSESILKAIEKLDYKTPTEIQHKVIPLLLKGKDIIGTSQTGSGKTAAFGIPICENIDILKGNPQALILTPTRELCVQIAEDITNIGRFKRIRSAAVFGKQPISVQTSELKQRVHIVVGTPGRTLDHIDKGSLVIDNIKYLVIDEADKMLNMGFFEEVISIVTKLPKNRITLLFSATMPQEIEELSKEYMKNPVKIEVLPKKELKNLIKQSCYEVSEADKLPLTKGLIYMYSPDSAIIFCNTQDKVDKLVSELKTSNFSCNGLHGGMLQAERLKVMKSFKDGEFSILVATDVAGRGIDVDSLDLIINYEVPFEKESYLHRIGRTGRAGKSGTAVTLSSNHDNKYLKEVEEYLGYAIPKAIPPKKDEIKVFKQQYQLKEQVSKPKVTKSSKFKGEITKIYINAGKKKKIRACDIAGALSNIPGMLPESIGIIDIRDTFTYVDILDGKGNIVLDALKDMTIKGKAIKAEKAK